MSSPFIGEIRMFGGSFAPAGWAFCNGQTLPISEYDALFTLIGTTYGGDGQETFALPDLQGRIPIHAGQGMGLSNRTLGEKSGSETVTLTVNQTPVHNHGFQASTDFSDTASPQGRVVSQSTIVSLYRESEPSSPMSPNAIVAGGGGNQPHDNTQPFQCVSFIISLYGIYPTQT
jgi:microcystin-dependent protein